MEMTIHASSNLITEDEDGRYLWTIIPEDKYMEAWLNVFDDAAIDEMCIVYDDGSHTMIEEVDQITEFINEGCHGHICAPIGYIVGIVDDTYVIR